MPVDQTPVRRRRLTPDTSDESEGTPLTVYIPPVRTAYPPEENIEVLIAEVEDIVQGDGVSSRASELARAIWELQGIILRRRFGDPTVVGSSPEPDPILTQRLHQLERMLASVRRKVADTYTISQPVARNGASARVETDALIVVLDCSARLTRVLRDACLTVRSSGTADAIG